LTGETLGEHHQPPHGRSAKNPPSHDARAGLDHSKRRLQRSGWLAAHQPEIRSSPAHATGNLPQTGIRRRSCKALSQWKKRSAAANDDGSSKPLQSEKYRPSRVSAGALGAPTTSFQQRRHNQARGCDRRVDRTCAGQILTPGLAGQHGLLTTDDFTAHVRRSTVSAEQQSRGRRVLKGAPAAGRILESAQKALLFFFFSF